MSNINDERKINERYKMMTEQPVRRLILKMAVPTIISMLVTTIYNMVDSFYVGHLSTEAVAGVGVSFAYMAFINACGFFFGHGSGNYISRALGAKQGQNAGRMAATGFFSPLILGAIAGLICMIFISPLSRAMGATDSILPYANDYLRFILLATPFMMSSLTLNNQLRLQGNARFGMIGIASGAILNIILDPIFIFLLDMGVSGASLATAVSQCFGWCVLLWGTSRPGNVHIKFKLSYLILLQGNHTRRIAFAGATGLVGGGHHQPQPHGGALCPAWQRSLYRGSFYHSFAHHLVLLRHRHRVRTRIPTRVRL